MSDKLTEAEEKILELLLRKKLAENNNNSSAIMCGHANEAPCQPCECASDCYCKVNGCCKNKGGNSKGMIKHG